jgi:hypothetical protein
VDDIERVRSFVEPAVVKVHIDLVIAELLAATDLLSMNCPTVDEALSMRGAAAVTSMTSVTEPTSSVRSSPTTAAVSSTTPLRSYFLNPVRVALMV